MNQEAQQALIAFDRHNQDLADLRDQIDRIETALENATNDLGRALAPPWLGVGQRIVTGPFGDDEPTIHPRWLAITCTDASGNGSYMIEICATSPPQIEWVPPREVE